MLSSMRKKTNERLGIGAMILAFFLAAIGFGNDEFTVICGYVGSGASVLFIGGVVLVEMLATRPSDQR